MLNPQSVTELLMYATMKITTDQGSGTGFVFRDEVEDKVLAYLITNKHVVKGASSIRLSFHLKDQNTEGPTGQSVTINYTLSAHDNVVMHPNADIDLCAVPIGKALDQLTAVGTPVYLSSISRNELVTSEMLSNLTAVEEVLMVGYPIGMSDDHNNFPIFRRGITASHPNIDFENKPEAVADIASFPGSSGSPIFLFNDHGYRTRDGAYNMATGRFALLGVLYGGPVLSLDGRVSIRSVPTHNVPIATTQVPIHLGYYIKAREILALADEVARREIVR